MAGCEQHRSGGHSGEGLLLAEIGPGAQVRHHGRGFVVQVGGDDRLNCGMRT